MGFPSIAFNVSQIDDIFPFHFIMNREMCVIQCGKSLKKIDSRIEGQDFNVVFICNRPSMEKLTFEGLMEIQKQVFVLKLRGGKELVLRGQFEYLTFYDSFIYVGSPWFHRIEELRESGLTLQDFAIQDPVVDLLHVVKTQELATQDVTDLMKTLRSQKEELKKLSLVAEESLSGVVLTDKDGVTTWVNKAFTHISGYSLKESVGKKPGELLQGKNTDKETVQYIRNQIRNHQSFVCEILNYTKQGAPYWIFISGQPIVDKKGNLTGFFAMEEDITARKIAEDKLRYSEEKYRSIIENMELGLIEVDNDGKIIKSYQRFCEMVGYKEGELNGKHAIELFVPNEYRYVLENQTTDRFNGKAGTYEIPLIHKNGSWVWVLISGAPIYNENGEVTGSVGIHYNLTERKILEGKLANAKKVAEEARHSEQKFLANMSHEIRTPLNAIIGMSHLLYDTRPSVEQKEYIDILSNSANFLHSLISNILDMAKIEAGKTEMNVKPFDLAGMVSTIQKTFQLKLEGKPIEVSAFIDSRIKGNYSGDETMLHQILANLMGNSEKFTLEGSIELMVKLLKKEDNNTVWIEFQVNDTGIGISKEDLALIFDKFKQVQGPQGLKYKGTGLGLSIVKELVEIQGGVISVSSEVGKGTSFKVVLPYEIYSEEAKEEKAISQIDIPDDFSGFTVLVVEDNVMNRKYLGKLLEKKNIQFEVAVDGLEAIRMAQQKKYDLILMDIQMPNMNGYEATLAIRNTQNHNKETPVIALTASAMLDQKNKAYQVGMNDYISKPFTPIQLFEKLVLYLVPTEKNQKPEKINSNFRYSSELDDAFLIELYGLDYDYALSMFQSFSQDIIPEFPKLSELVEKKEMQALGRLAHQIKPTTSMVGLTELEKMIQSLEDAIHNHEEEESIKAQVGEIIRYFESKKEFVLSQLKALEKTSK